MMQNVEHVETSEDGLSRTVWTFWLLDEKVRLQAKRTERRRTKRHKWTVVAAWPTGRHFVCLERPADDEKQAEGMEAIRNALVWIGPTWKKASRGC